MRKVLCWVELVGGGLLLAFGIWLRSDVPGEVDRHGYLALGTAAVIGLALLVLLAGGALGTRSRWGWLGQLPLAALLLAAAIDVRCGSPAEAVRGDDCLDFGGSDDYAAGHCELPLAAERSGSRDGV